MLKFCFGIVLVLAQNDLPPDVSTLQFSYYALENTTRDTVLFNFVVKYRDGHRNVTVTTGDSDRYVKVQRVNGSDSEWNVILNSELDREVSLETDKRNASF